MVRSLSDDDRFEALTVRIDSFNKAVLNTVTGILKSNVVINP
jgi:hypothetical protein